MLKNDVCTVFNLKKFCFSTLQETIPAFDLARFVECQSSFKYTVIEIRFILDAFKTLEEYIELSSRFKQEFEEKWHHLNFPKNKITI